MDEGGLAPHEKKAARLGASIAFIDESGLLMAPLVRRSWAPRGNTPVLYQRTRSHKKVSAVAALIVSPARDRVSLFFRLLPNANFNAVHVRGFLNQLGRQLETPVVVLWDRFLPHRAKRAQSFFSDTPGFHRHFFPPYAPELNPVEYLWSWLKRNPLANLAPDSLEVLAVNARKGGRSVQRKQALLRSFVAHSPLSLRLK